MLSAVNVKGARRSFSHLVAFIFKSMSLTLPHNELRARMQCTGVSMPEDVITEQIIGHDEAIGTICVGYDVHVVVVVWGH
jgi:hypothetical protein